MTADTFLIRSGDVVAVTVPEVEPVEVVTVLGPRGRDGATGPAGSPGSRGDTGPAGSAATIAIGTVSTLPPGSEATVTNSGTSSAAVFDFAIPGGDTGGGSGSTATIDVGTVSTGVAGSSASVTNSGTSTTAVFNFVIPRGDTGATGSAGLRGSDGATGTAATINVGTVSTGVAGSSATVTNIGSSSAATFDFSIPRGDTGSTGEAATISVGTVTTGSPGSSATITNSGNTTTAVFDVTLPRGDTGPQGSAGTTSWNGLTNKPAIIAAGATQAEARAVIGAGTSDLVLGTSDTAAKRGDYTPSSSEITTALGYTPESSANRNASGGYAGLDSSGLIPAALLPGFVDDVIEGATTAAFPATGASGRLYVALDTGKVYRWGGSTYIEVSSSPGSTDDVPEGSVNQYFTAARAQTALTSQLAGKSDVGHTHSQSDVTGLGSALAGKSDVGHGHAQSDVTGLTSALAGKSDVGHTHSQSDVTGLTSALSAKSDVGHTHSQSDVSGLTSALAGKLGTGDTAAAATKLATSRTIQVDLGSTGPAGFDGTGDVSPGVTGSLPQSAVSGLSGSLAGKLDSGATAAAATKLATPRTVQVDLGSTAAASFDGTSNVSPGVTGSLPQSYVTNLTSDLAAKESAANKGTAGGYASLDSGGKVPVSQLPSSIMEYQGVWNASTNTPTLVDGTGNTGDVYRVTVAASRNLGSGAIDFQVGDYVIYNPGGVWEKSDTTDAVATVNGYTGNVSLTKSDIGLSSADNTADANKNVLSATKLTTARTIDGQSFDGTANITVIAPGTAAATDKATPVDADVLPLVDSAASNVLKKLSWANLKAAIATYYNSLQATITNKTITSPQINQINDTTNNRTVIGFAAGSSSNTSLTFTAGTTSVSLGLQGPATNASVNLVPRGTGTVQANGVDVVTTTGTQSVSNKTLTSPTLTSATITDYTESVVAIGTVTSSNTLSLTNGTVQTATLTASTACTFTMPTAVAGKSFTLLLKQAASTGNGTATFTNVKWNSSGAPTITATAGKMDILSFFSDGTNWYGSYTQGYTP